MYKNDINYFIYYIYTYAGLRQRLNQRMENIDEVEIFEIKTIGEMSRLYFFITNNANYKDLVGVNSIC